VVFKVLAGLQAAAEGNAPQSAARSPVKAKKRLEGKNMVEIEKATTAA
jgi:hypothetical protein